MISGINSNSSYQFQMQQPQTLSGDKKKALQEIVDKYDPEKTTGDGVKSMMEEIRKAGFTPMDGSKEIIEAAGFSLPEPPQGGPEKMGPPPGGGKGSMPDYMSDFLTKQSSGGATQEDITTLIESLQKDGKFTSGSIIDVKS